LRSGTRRRRRGRSAPQRGGRELDALGHEEDVDIAAELDSSLTVPVLDGELFTSR
jgi:hypothetical protein